jgi:hypothetical protein
MGRYFRIVWGDGPTRFNAPELLVPGYQEMPIHNALRYPWTMGADYFVFPPHTQGEAAVQGHPVLCFLHGVGEAVNGGNAEGVAAHQSPAWHAANGSRLTAPFLIVCPQRLEPGRWTAIDAKNLHSVLDQVIVKHSGCPERVFLTGFSYGGDAVFRFPIYERRLLTRSPIRYDLF